MSSAIYQALVLLDPLVASVSRTSILFHGSSHNRSPTTIFSVEATISFSKPAFRKLGHVIRPTAGKLASSRCVTLSVSLLLFLIDRKHLSPHLISISQSDGFGSIRQLDDSTVALVIAAQCRSTCDNLKLTTNLDTKEQITHEDARQTDHGDANPIYCRIWTKMAKTSFPKPVGSAA